MPARNTFSSTTRRNRPLRPGARTSFGSRSTTADRCSRLLAVAADLDPRLSPRYRRSRSRQRPDGGLRIGAGRSAGEGSGNGPRLCQHAAVSAIVPQLQQHTGSATTQWDRFPIHGTYAAPRGRSERFVKRLMGDGAALIRPFSGWGNEKIPHPHPHPERKKSCSSFLEASTAT